jgi:integrase
MSRGHIRRQGKASWELKFDVPTDDGKRRTRFVTVRGTRKEAQRELTRLLGSADLGTLPEPSKITVAEYLRNWLGQEKEGEPVPPPAGITPKTAERYRELAEFQIIPHLGEKRLQKLRPAHVTDWHERLLKDGARDGKPLSPTTVGHAHRLLSKALKRAAQSEIVPRNVASIISPPAVNRQEVVILTADQIADTLAKFEPHPLYAVAVFDLASGLRRGELVALRLIDVDLDAAQVHVRRAVEETKAGIRVKEPKTEKGRRTVSLPPSAVAVLREHRKRLLEQRLALGLGKPDDDALLFPGPDGQMMPPNQLSWLWRSACKHLKAPRVNFHSLRHSHASALIASGLDVLAVSRRLGHADATTTLRVYGHLFKRDESAAVDAIEAVLRTPRER